MNRLLPLCLVLLSASVLPGCHYLRRTPKPKESTAIAADVENTFRQRWLDKRAAELKATGLAPPAAQARAESEFSARYSYLESGRK